MPASQPVPARRSAGSLTNALGAAVCATLGAGAAHATPIVVDIPDVTVSGPVGVDFNGDGVAEFTFDRQAGSLGPAAFEGVTVDTHGNAVVASTKGSSYAAALSGGETIDAARTFTSGDSIVLAKYGVGIGEFQNSGLGYLGVRFTIPADADPHFGFIEVSATGDRITLTRLLWDSGIGTPVVTPGGSVPEPGTLALLVAGAGGVLALRRRRASAASAASA